MAEALVQRERESAIPRLAEGRVLEDRRRGAGAAADVFRPPSGAERRHNRVVIERAKLILPARVDEARRDGQPGRDLAVDSDRGVMRVRRHERRIDDELERWIGSHRRFGQPAAARVPCPDRQQIRKLGDQRANTVRSSIEDRRNAIEAGDVVVIEPPVRGAHGGPLRPRGIPDRRQSRRHIVVVARESIRVEAGRRVFRVRPELPLVSHAHIHRDVSPEAPVVLPEQREIANRIGRVRRAVALDVRGGQTELNRLNGVDRRERQSEQRSRQGRGKHVAAAEVERQCLVLVLDDARVESRFELVPSSGKADRIEHLPPGRVPGLRRESLASHLGEAGDLQRRPALSLLDARPAAQRIE